MHFDPNDPINPDVAEMIRQKALKLGRDLHLQHADVEDVDGHLKAFIVENAWKLIARTAGQMTVIDRAIQNEICNLVNHWRAKKRDGRRNVSIDYAPSDVFMRMDDTLIGTPSRLDVSAAIERMPDNLRQLALLLTRLKPAEVQRALSLTRGELRHQMEQIEKFFVESGIDGQSNHSEGGSGQ